MPCCVIQQLRVHVAVKHEAAVKHQLLRTLIQPSASCRLGLGGKMEDLMDTSDFVSEADFLANAPTPAKPAGKEAPELLSDMSGCLPTTA